MIIFPVMSEATGAPPWCSGWCHWPWNLGPRTG